MVYFKKLAKSILFLKVSMKEKKNKTAYCFDLDGTVTQEEILPEIANVLGIKEEIYALTKATMNGHLNFESSFKLRVRLLSSVGLEIVRDIVSRVKINSKIQKFINSQPNNCFIVTGNLDVWINILKDKINCKMFSSSALMQNDQIIGIKNILDKGFALKVIRDLGFERIICVGDGMNDISMFEQSDLSIAFGGVHEPFDTLIQLADYITYDEEGLCQVLKSL
jgi:HAD superfamily phosphoserine phosphatase-like hydrolase